MKKRDAKYGAVCRYCEGDVEGLEAALGEEHEVLFDVGSDEGYGHHSYDTIYRTGDGRIAHAECGGCSCGGSGSWSYETSYEAALGRVPEHRRSDEQE